MPIIKNDGGTRFAYTVMQGATSLVVDLSSATLLEILLRKPVSATVVAKSLSYSTDGTDGKVFWTSATTDLDEAGNWEMQIHARGPFGEFHTETKTFLVRPRLEVTP